MRHARMHLAAAELFGDRQSERFSIRSYGGGGKPSDGPTPIDLTSQAAAARPMACVRNVYDTRWSPLRLAMIF